MCNTKEYIVGGWKYKTKLKYDEKHKGFWHKLFCSVVTTQTTTFGCDYHGWTIGVETYACGCENHIRRTRLDDD